MTPSHRFTAFHHSAPATVPRSQKRHEHPWP